MPKSKRLQMLRLADFATSRFATSRIIEKSIAGIRDTWNRKRRPQQRIAPSTGLATTNPCHHICNNKSMSSMPSMSSIIAASGSHSCKVVCCLAMIAVPWEGFIAGAGATGSLSCGLFHQKLLLLFPFPEITPAPTRGLHVQHSSSGSSRRVRQHRRIKQRLFGPVLCLTN